jgi:hypothetical protein
MWVSFCNEVQSCNHDGFNPIRQWQLSNQHCCCNDISTPVGCVALHLCVCTCVPYPPIGSHFLLVSAGTISCSCCGSEAWSYPLTRCCAVGSAHHGNEAICNRLFRCSCPQLLCASHHSSMRRPESYVAYPARQRRPPCPATAPQPAAEFKHPLQAAHQTHMCYNMRRIDVGGVACCLNTGPAARSVALQWLTTTELHMNMC